MTFIDEAPDKKADVIGIGFGEGRIEKLMYNGYVLPSVSYL